MRLMRSHQPFKLILAVAAIAALSGCSRGPSPPTAALASFSGDRLLNHIRVLSSDEFEGRGPGSKGEKLTIKYLEDQYRSAGLEPGNPDGTYLQSVPLVGIQGNDNVASGSRRCRLPQPVADRGAQAQILGVPMNRQREIAAILLQDLLGAVGAAVVHDDNGKAQVLLGQAFEDAAQQVADVRLFVKGGQDHEDSRTSRRLRNRPDYRWRQHACCPSQYNKAGSAFPGASSAGHAPGNLLHENEQPVSKTDTALPRAAPTPFKPRVFF